MYLKKKSFTNILIVLCTFYFNFGMLRPVKFKNFGWSTLKCTIIIISYINNNNNKKNTLTESDKSRYGLLYIFFSAKISIFFFFFIFIFIIIQQSQRSIPSSSTSQFRYSETRPVFKLHIFLWFSWIMIQFSNLSFHLYTRTQCKKKKKKI